MCCLDICSEGSKGLTGSPPALARYNHYQVGRSPQPSQFPHQIGWTSYTALQPNGFHFPASWWNYSYKSITCSCRKQRAPHPLVTTKLAFHNPVLAHSAPKCTCDVALCSPRHPPTPGCEYKWLINCCQSHLSHVGCRVFSHLVLFQALDPFFTCGKQGSCGSCPQDLGPIFPLCWGGEDACSLLLRDPQVPSTFPRVAESLAVLDNRSDDRSFPLSIFFF